VNIVLTVTPSLNKIKGHWQIWNWRKRYIKELSGYCYFAPKTPKRAVLRIKRYGSRELDCDNLVAGLKPLLDAMKKTGLIVDDRSKWLEVKEFVQVKCKRGEEKLEVELVYDICEK
jgi:Holliday junction resolvase RusA-like endonuclease